MENNYLMHHGVKGMRWGIRRFQNKDGSLTAAGKKRQREEEPAHEDYERAHSKTSVRTMSDRELRETNNRLQAERQYEQLTKKVNKGIKAVNTFIAVAGTAAAIVTAVGQFKGAYDLGKSATTKLMGAAKAAKKATDLSGVGVDTLADMAGKI